MPNSFKSWENQISKEIFFQHPLNLSIILWTNCVYFSSSKFYLINDPNNLVLNTDRFASIMAAIYQDHECFELLQIRSDH